MKVPSILTTLMIHYKTGEVIADHRVNVLKIVLDRICKGQEQNSQAPVSTEEEADGKLRYGAYSCNYTLPAQL